MLFSFQTSAGKMEEQKTEGAAALPELSTGDKSVRSETAWLFFGTSCTVYRYFCPAVCPRSSDPFHIVSYYINWVTTSWTYSTRLDDKRILHIPACNKYPQ